MKEAGPADDVLVEWHHDHPAAFEAQLEEARIRRDFTHELALATARHR
jgi:hypothetical protein